MRTACRAPPAFAQGIVTAPVTPPTDPSDAPDPTAAPAAPALPARPKPPRPAVVPIGWLLDRGSNAVRARALLELAGLAGAGAESAARLALAHLPAVRLALGQGRDGTWEGRMLTLARAEDPDFVGVGTVPAVRRLLEYGWPTDAPPFWHARRPLFRLLAQDDDPGFLYELRGDAPDVAHVRHARLRLREASGAALAQLGFESDPRLRGMAARALERVSSFLKGEPPPTGEPLAESCAPPSLDLLVMLAFMPTFRSEHGDEMNRLVTFLTQPPPRGTVRQRVGRLVHAQPQFVLGDPLAEVTELDARNIGRVIAWLEVLARLGALRRHEPWRALLDRVLAACDVDGRWTRAVTAPVADAVTWPPLPLGNPAERGEWQADVTFRIALVAKLAGRPLELV